MRHLQWTRLSRGGTHIHAGKTWIQNVGGIFRYAAGANQSAGEGCTPWVLLVCSGLLLCACVSRCGLACVAWLELDVLYCLWLVAAHEGVS